MARLLLIQVAKRLNKLENEDKRLTRSLADQALEIPMLKYLQVGYWDALPVHALQ